MNVRNEFANDFDLLFSRRIDMFPQLERNYIMSSTIHDDSILFVGLNPSYQIADNGNNWYDLDGTEGGYFAKFSDIGLYCQHPWSHLDLLGIRETKQNNISELENTNLQFIWDNLQLTKRILEASKPKIIVVTNTMARKYLGKDRIENQNVWLDYDFGDIQDDGTFLILNKDSKLQNVPIFFSSMLTGHRALDKGSYERLKWHIKKVLKNIGT